MLRPAATLAAITLAAALSPGQPGAPTDKIEQIPSDPVLAVYQWLATGPAPSDAAANPGAAAFDLATTGGGRLQAFADRGGLDRPRFLSPVRLPVPPSGRAAGNVTPAHCG